MLSLSHASSKRRSYGYEMAAMREARLRELDVAFASLFTVEDLRDAASP